jgi:hypothetical protein
MMTRMHFFAVPASDKKAACQARLQRGRESLRIIGLVMNYVEPGIAD